MIGVPEEIKDNEFRVGMTPASVAEAVHHGHEVMVETRAGLGIDATDDHYKKAGARIVDTAEEVFAKADMVVKVKEPQVAERKMMREGQVLFTYLHLAPDPEQTKDLVGSDAICIAYETVTDAHGGLPLLAPMSQVAGRMSVQAGAHALEMAQGGRGVLLAGVPGVQPAKVVIVGGGHMGCFVPYPDAVAPAHARFVFHRMECYHCFWRCTKRARDGDVFPCVGAVSEDQVWEALQGVLGGGAHER